MKMSCSSELLAIIDAAISGHIGKISGYHSITSLVYTGKRRPHFLGPGSGIFAPARRECQAEEYRRRSLRNDPLDPARTEGNPVVDGGQKTHLRQPLGQVLRRAMERKGGPQRRLARRRGVAELDHEGDGRDGDAGGSAGG